MRQVNGGGSISAPGAPKSLNQFTWNMAQATYLVLGKHRTPNLWRNHMRASIFWLLMFISARTLRRNFLQEESLIHRYQKIRSIVLRYFGMTFGLIGIFYHEPQIIHHFDKLYKLAFRSKFCVRIKSVPFCWRRLFATKVENTQKYSTKNRLQYDETIQYNILQYSWVKKYKYIYFIIATL